MGTKKDRGKIPLSMRLSRRLQHILNKNPVSSCWIIHQNMGNCAHQFSVLDNGTAAQE